MKGKDFWVAGYVCAAAVLVQQHDQPSMAEDLLNEVAPIKWRSIDAWDRDVLKKAGIKLKDYA
jgi:hypothetical protein